MKKYRLIKKYPGSPKLGTEVIKNNEFGNYSYIEPNIKEYSKNIIENNPEFWEEVVKKDYEILQVSIIRSIKHEIIDVSNYGEGYKGYILALSKCDGNSIHSVKRLSDGEIFTVGDKCKRHNDHILIITGFILKSFNVLKINDYWNINDLKHIKKPLFTTKDGVDIFEGDNIHWVCNEFTYFYTKNVNKEHYNLISGGKSGLFKICSTKKEAEEYILMNKPYLSLKEIYDLTDENSGLYNKSDLKKLVQQKLNL